MRSARAFSWLLALFFILAPLAAQEPTTEQRDELLTRAFFVLRTGDAHAFRTTAPILSERLGRLADAPERWSVFFGPDSLSMVYEFWLDRNLEALRRQGLPAAAAAHRPERELALRLLILDAACHEDRQLALQQLHRVEQLASRAPGARGRISRFLAASYRAWLDFDLRVPEAQELRRRHAEALKELEGLEPDPDLVREALVEIPLLQRTSAFWMRRLIRAGAFPEAAATLERAVELNEAVWRLPSDSSGSLDRFGLKLQLVELRALNTVILLEGLRSTSPALAGTLESCEDFYAFLQEQSHSEEAGTDIWIARARAMMLGEDRSALLVVPLRGAVSRALVALHRAAARESSQGEEVLKHLRRALQVSRPTEDYAGTQDILLDLGEADVQFQPEGWQAEVDSIVADALPHPSRYFQVRALILRGREKLALGRKAEALEDLQKAVDLLEGYLREVSEEAGTLAQVRETYASVYELLARLQLEAGQAQAAAATVDRMHQAGTLVNLPLRDLKPARADLRRELDHSVALKDRLATLEQSQADPGLIASSRQEFYQALDSLQRAEPTYGRLSVRPANFSRIQADLPEDTVLVQLFPTPEHLYFFVATRHSLRIRQVSVPARELLGLVGTFRRLVVAFSRSSRSLDWETPEGQELARVLTELGQLLWKPIEPDLAGKRQLVFIPTAALHYFPLQALARPGTGGRPRFLIEEIAVSLATKSSDLDGLARPARSQGRSMLVLADPDGSLAGARQEASDVSSLFPGSRVYVGPQATRDCLVGLSPQVGYVHFATHGFLNSAVPTDSYLLVSGGTGQLTVGEIAGLELGPVRLVTLSACQSALADRNPEVGWELASLADAFGFAGSSSMLASLWKVSDTTTRDLMVAFYRELASGVGRAEALRRAELKMLDRPETAHPFHWASFVLLGDWR